MKISGAWLTSSGTQAVFEALTSQGHHAYAVGGCVRNELMGVPTTDIDIATAATPDVVQELAKAAGLKSVPTGIDHGTVTIVSEKIGYEVTTFRADAETDGRHAIVRFSTDMKEDASRRDFTMNALYADATGTVIDPLGGITDLRSRKVRFIGDAKERIEEDYLRILRFFRFAAWYGDPDHGFDADALAAIADSLDGLTTLSRERVGAELLKLLSAVDPGPAVGTMEHTGVLHTVLPGSNPRALGLLAHQEKMAGLTVDPIRRLASLGIFDGEPLRLSKKQQNRLSLLQRMISGTEAASGLGYRHGERVAIDVLLLRSAMFESPLDPHALADASLGSSAKFPVKAIDLMPEFSGAALGKRLRDIEDRWIISGFKLSKSELLN